MSSISYPFLACPPRDIRILCSRQWLSNISAEYFGKTSTSSKIANLSLLWSFEVEFPVLLFALANVKTVSPAAPGLWYFFSSRPPRRSFSPIHSRALPLLEWVMNPSSKLSPLRLNPFGNRFDPHTPNVEYFSLYLWHLLFFSSVLFFTQCGNVATIMVWRIDSPSTACRRDRGSALFLRFLLVEESFYLLVSFSARVTHPALLNHRVRLIVPQSFWPLKLPKLLLTFLRFFLMGGLLDVLSLLAIHRLLTIHIVPFGTILPLSLSVKIPFSVLNRVVSRLPLFMTLAASTHEVINPYSFLLCWRLWRLEQTVPSLYTPRVFHLIAS